MTKQRSMSRALAEIRKYGSISAAIRAITIQAAEANTRERAKLNCVRKRLEEILEERKFKGARLIVN